MAIGNLLISGACERTGAYELGEGKYYDKAVLLELDISTGTFSELLVKSEGGQHYPDEFPNLQYTSGCVDGDTLWLPTDTEIYRCRLPDVEIVDVISHPCFQNIHSVYKFGQELVVTSTGLDNVVFVSSETGEIVDIVNAEGKEPWHRFDKSTDYRLVHSTRPHSCHPNYVFSLDGSLWVTRCKQEDAVNLNDFSETIDISMEDTISVHDGVLWRDKIVFTRVDSLLAVFDADTKAFIENINPFEKTNNRPMGWCRGLYIDENIFYMGFSKIRKTRLKNKLKYLAKGNFKYSTGNSALIVAYDYVKRELVKVYETPPGLIDAVYGVMPYSK